MKIKILVVEDEQAIREMLEMVFENEGFEIIAVESAERALESLSDRIPDLILLDWMLPGISGIELEKRLKKSNSYNAIPIILLTARGEEEDKIKGLETGADDFITKPFSPKELIARIKAVVRRTNKAIGGGRIVFGELALDVEQHQIMIGNEPVEVSPTEFRLLQFFMSNPDKVYSRSQLLDQVWGRNIYINERTVDVHIRRLRKILAKHEIDELVQTVRGFGYRFSISGK
jgi:two-component system phosphate regulon response regulator PhoB